MKGATTAAVVLICVCSVAACSSASTPSESSLLPIGVVLDLSAVRSFFPAVTHVAQTGPDTTAQGNPTATRSVFYENDSGVKRVTISVDRYRNATAAASAYSTALEKSEAVPGFRLLKVPNLAERTFAGTVTMKAETHVGIGVLSKNLVVGATLAGFDSSHSTVSKLVSMTRAQIAHLDANSTLSI